MSDDPSDRPSPGAPHRGMIPRGDLPFLPRVNWKFWAPILALLVAFPLYWSIQRDRKARRLRAQLLSEHESITSTLAPDYRRKVSAIERWALASVGPYQGDFRDSALTYPALTEESVLYGRVRARELRTARDLAPSARHRYPDQLASCLGVEPWQLRDLLDKGTFLLPSYVDSVRATDDADRLHALREDLIFRLRRDTEAIVQGLRRPYFVLVVDEGLSSIDGPSRVFVWDLQRERPLLRARASGSEVVLIPFRIAGLPAPAPRTSARYRPPTVSQHDCAVANRARSLLGVEVLSLQNTPAPESGDASAPADAASDAAPLAPSDAPSRD